MCRVVVDGADDHTTRPGNRRAQRSALQLAIGITRFQILHFARVAGGDPLGELVEFREVSDGSDANQIEASIFRRLFYERRYFFDRSQSGRSPVVNYIIPASMACVTARLNQTDPLPIIASTVEEKTERSSWACSPGIDFEIKIIAVPWVTAHSASPRRV